MTLQTFNQNRTLAHDPGGDVKREARDWPITYDELEPYYTKAEELIGLNGTRQNQIKALGATSRDFYQAPLHRIRTAKMPGVGWTPLA